MKYLNPPNDTHDHSGPPSACCGQPCWNCIAALEKLCAGLAKRVDDLSRELVTQHVVAKENGSPE